MSAAAIPAARPPILTVRAIADAACALTDVTYVDLISPRRNDRVVRVRQVVMYLARTLTPRTYLQIGAALGGRDHTTVMHGVRRIAEALAGCDPVIGGMVREIEIGALAYARLAARRAFSMPGEIDALAVAREALADPRRMTMMALCEVEALASAVVQAAGGPDGERPPGDEARLDDLIARIERLGLVACVDGANEATRNAFDTEFRALLTAARAIREQTHG